MTQEPTEQHAPVLGAWTIAGVPACTCGYRHRARHGSQARKGLRKHLAKHTPKGQP